MQLQVRPVIQSGSFYSYVVQTEAQGLDKVQSAVGAYAKAAYIASILGDFGLKENNMQHERSLKPYQGLILMG